MEQHSEILIRNIKTELVTSTLTCTAGSAGRGTTGAATGDRNSQSCSELHPEWQRSDEYWKYFLQQRLSFSSFSSLPIANIECYQDLIEAVSHRFPRISFVKFLYTNFQRDLIQDYHLWFLINPPREDKNVDKVSNKTKDWHQDHQDADHPGELKYEKLMPLCPGRHSSQHFHCWEQSKQINESPPCVCVCVIYLIYIKHPPLVRQWMGHEGRKEKWKQISFVILFESVKYILPYLSKIKLDFWKKEKKLPAVRYWRNQAMSN